MSSQGVALEIQKYKLQLGYQCAPVIKNVKASNIIVLPNNMEEWIFSIWNDTEVSVHILCELEEKTVFFFYRKERLYKHLNQKENKQFLKKFGYEFPNYFKEKKLYKMLQYLSVRYEKYYKEHGEFPHELGIFLEYPIEDVKGFIVNRGRNSLLTGYWKVYHNLEAAQRVFLKYDLAKEEVVSAIVAGQSLQKVMDKKADR